MSAPDTSDSDVKGSEYNTATHLEDVSSRVPDQVCDPWSGVSASNPQEWPQWKKNAQILMVAFHSMVATFMAAGIIPAYDTMAEVYGVTVPQASYLTSVQVSRPRLSLRDEKCMEALAHIHFS